MHESFNEIQNKGRRSLDGCKWFSIFNGEFQVESKVTQDLQSKFIRQTGCVGIYLSISLQFPFAMKLQCMRCLFTNVCGNELIRQWIIFGKRLQNRKDRIDSIEQKRCDHWISGISSLLLSWIYFIAIMQGRCAFWH